MPDSVLETLNSMLDGGAVSCSVTEHKPCNSVIPLHVVLLKAVKLRSIVVMLIFLAFALHVLQYGLDIQAAPLSAVIESACEASAALPATCDCPNPESQRSSFDIIWSCLVTLFACTWISVHPNLPAASDRRITIIRRRVRIMLYALIVPEGVMYWAMRQFLGSRKLARRYEAHGWTKVHGHFLQMGGFMMHEPEKEPYTLSRERMETLLDRGEIDLPSTTEAEINDKSKGDILAKGIVVIQTFWFVLQCIARGAQGLTITELELVTLAFAAFNGITYYFWWNKPLDVQCPVHVYLKKSKMKGKKVEKEIRDEAVKRHKPGLWQRFLDVMNDLLDVLYFDIYDEVKGRGFRNTVGRRILIVACVFRIDWQMSRGVVVRWLLLIIHPFMNARETLHQMTESDHSTTVKGDAQRVPTFYALKMDIQSEYMLDCAMTFFAMLFGAIHCVAWLFHFPSAVERNLWRFASLAIVLVPGFVLFLALMRWVVLNPWLNKWRMFAFIVMNVFDQKKILLVVNIIGLAIYIPARLLIISLALSSLRALSPDAFIEVDWTTFLPHI
ncbi:hypothetical protein B0H34DRAFT_697016 [Crassisporium funariophilum]|nr:hypothetical protein B0H34DRAFT_697016 [Crassisporium funariophilum]